MMRSATAVETIDYARHSEIRLSGDYYRAASSEAPTAPVVIAVHGGGWKIGSAKEFQYIGPWLAQRGIAVLSIEYRLVQAEMHRYPSSALDVRAAVQFVRSNAGQLGIDPARIGLLGASAGAHLATLVALAGETAALSQGFPDGPCSSVNSVVKAVVGIYGPYDLLAQWDHDQATRPHDNLAENYLGKSAVDDKFLYFSASPLAHVSRSARNKPSFFLSWGTEDDIVDPARQSKPFVTALKQAGYFVRTAPMQGAPHYWIAAPIDEPGSYSGIFAPQLFRFLRERL